MIDLISLNTLVAFRFVRSRDSAAIRLLRNP